jgi:hypothetical protein
MSTAREPIGQQALEVLHEQQEMRDAGQDAPGEKLEQSPDTDLDNCQQATEHLLYADCGVRQLMRQLPIKTALVALGAGVLLGSFWTIRRR